LLSTGTFPGGGYIWNSDIRASTPKNKKLKGKNTKS
jgi:hypothetical protein